MDLSLNKNELKHYIIAQMDTFFPDKYSVNIIGIDKVFSLAIERMEYCFSRINLKTYSCEGSVFFNHLHSDQYAAFLWFLSNTLWTELQDEKVASKLFY
jgi:serine O-acetyltransferase